LKVGSIDHWCLGGGNDFCKCEDPLQPQARAEFRKWTNTHIANKEMVNSWVEHDKDPDIAFFGASVVEEMDGRWFGSANDTDLRGLGTLFDNNFNKEKGGSLDGVALGIAGDTVSIVIAVVTQIFKYKQSHLTSSLLLESLYFVEIGEWRNACLF
jgi:hypothetical protein